MRTKAWETRGRFLEDTREFSTGAHGGILYGDIWCGFFYGDIWCDFSTASTAPFFSVDGQINLKTVAR